MNDMMKIREIKSTDISEICGVVSLHNTMYGTKRTPEQWIWEYMSNYPDLFTFALIEDGGRIIGTQGMIPIYISIEGKRHLSGKSESSLLDPKYRGKNSFQELYEFAMSQCKAKNIDFVWGYTPAVKVWKNKLRFSVYENALYVSILILKLQNLQNDLPSVFNSKLSPVKKIVIPILAAFCYLYSSCRVRFRFLRKSSKTGYSIKYKLRDINDLNTLYERLRKDHPNLIHIDQDEKYLAWRIYENPNIKYKTYFVYEGSLLRAYCYVNNKDNNAVFLTDFTFENDEAGEFLLRSLLGEWRKEKISIVSFLGNSKNLLMTNVFNLLKRFGFVKVSIPRAFVLKNISYEGGDQLYDIKNWYANGLWAEGYDI